MRAKLDENLGNRGAEPLCANVAETVTPQKITVATEQGETGISHANCGFLVDGKVGNRSDGNSKTKTIYGGV